MSGKAGYSLIEVLIAFVIVTLVLSALIPGQAMLLQRTVAQADRTLAFDYALSQAAHLGVTRPLAVGQTSETYRDWHVTTDIVPAAAASGFDVSITVFSASGARLAQFETHMATP